MASKFELQLAMKQMFDKIVPKAVGKMKVDDMAHALKALTVAAEYAEKTPKVPHSKAVRAIPVTEETVEETTIKVPSVPTKKVTMMSTSAEKAAATAAAGVAHVRNTKIVVTKKPTPKTKKVVAILEEPPAPAAPAPTPAPVASAVPVVEDDTDPKAARIVRAHKSAAAPVVEVTPKKVHRCNCLFCDKKGTTV